MQFLRTESTNSRDLNIRYSHTGTTHSFLSWGGKKRRKREKRKKEKAVWANMQGMFRRFNARELVVDKGEKESRGNNFSLKFHFALVEEHPLSISTRLSTNYRQLFRVGCFAQ